MDDGFYYLHTNGALIWKRFRPDPSDFVVQVWAIDTTDRACAWSFLLEALASGASIGRVSELAAKWECNTQDLPRYMARNPTPSAKQKSGIRMFLSQVLHFNPDEWFDWLAATPKGQKPDFAAMPDAAQEATQ